MLSDDQVNETVINVETVPSGVQNHLSSNMNVPGKSAVNLRFGTASSISGIKVTDRNDRRAKQSVRFSSLNKMCSRSHYSSDSGDMDMLCTSLQGSKSLGPMSKDSLPVIPQGFLVMRQAAG